MKMESILERGINIVAINDN